MITSSSSNWHRGSFLGNDKTSKYPYARDRKSSLRHFLTKTLEILHKDFSYDCICPHQIWFISDKGGGVKRGGGRILLPPA